jgi:hypothetical protein
MLRFGRYSLHWILNLAFALLSLMANAQTPAQGTSGALSDRTVIPFLPSLADSAIRLPHQFIVERSDTVWLDSTLLLLRGKEYVLDYRHGLFRLDSSFVHSHWQPGGKPSVLTVVYHYLPLTFQDSYFLRRLRVMHDSTAKRDSIRVERPFASYTVEDFFGPNLQKSGSLVRGFTIGSNRDLSLNSGLRLQFSGKLTSDLDVAASLTDENTPLQPEGTTQTLQEFDKVFVELKGKNVAGTLGDYVLDIQGTEFGRVNRKLQGARVTADMRTEDVTGGITVAGAISRGKFNSMQFTGLEGVQGPYRLTGRNGERAIIVIAGTEKVYINGERQTRGETNDYTIDYSTGEVTFTTRRLITSASRITVDFEYTDRQFSRSLFASQVSSGLASERARLSFSYFREADNPDAPIDFVLSDTARAILANAGGDRSKATMTGVTQVDSNGFYVRVDTVIAGNTEAIYRYAPGDPNARYNVTFSFVGTGQGDYARQQAGVFIWQGKGSGDYLPIRLLPLPELQQLVDASLEIVPVNNLKIGGEFAHSTSELNRLSTLPGSARGGNAFTIKGVFTPSDIRIGGANLGSLELSLKTRRTDQQFQALDRTNEIEFNRKWGIDTVQAVREDLLETGLKYRPSKTITLGGNYGAIERGSDMKSTRWDASLVSNEPGLPLVDYFIERVRSDEGQINSSSAWLRHHGTASYALGPFTPRFRFEGENRSFRGLTDNVVRPGSFKFDDFGPGVSLTNLGKFSASMDFGWRNEWAWLAGSVIPQARSFTQSYSARLSDWQNLSSSLDVALRRREFKEEFQAAGNSNIQTVLVRSQTRYTPFQRGLETDLYYETATQQSSRLERVFVRVTQGTGTYRYLGDLNNNGLADDNEFVQARFDGDYIPITVPSDQLLPIIDLKGSIRVRITPARFLTSKDGSLGRIISALSAETYARVDEKSTERDLKQIYLLHFSRFQRDSTTLTGSNIFSQDLFILDGNPSFSTRLRYSERRGLNNFNGGIERNFGKERSIRIRFRLIPEIAQQLDYANKNDRVTGDVPSTRLRDILSDELTFDFSYRPEQRFELGLKIGTSTSTDRLPAVPLEASLNTEGLRMIYAFEGAGQVRAEFSREEVLLSHAVDVFPYELTGGRLRGKTWLWHAGLEYRLTNFLQANASYDGRSEGAGPVVHTARAEVRAFF